MPENFSKFITKEGGGDFHHSEVAELEQPIKIILKKMLENIDKGEYDLVIGIDASGRIPAIIVGGFIKHIYSEKGYSSPEIRFVAGNVSEENAEEQIKKWNPRKRVLIVDDTIATGGSILNLCRVLNKNYISFDIATIATFLATYSDTSELRDDVVEKLGARNIYFGVTDDVPNIYGYKFLSGVEKEGKGETFSQPSIKTWEEPYRKEIAESIKQSRSDANVVISRLVDWYKSQKQEKK